MEHFAFSVKKVSGKPDAVTMIDYEHYISHIKKLGVKLEHINYEHDKQQGRLHFHAVIAIPKGFLRTRLRKEGFNVDYKPLTDKKGWLAYIRKDQKMNLFKKQEYVPTPEDEADYLKWSLANEQPYTDDDIQEMFQDDFIIDLDKIKI